MSGTGSADVLLLRMSQGTEMTLSTSTHYCCIASGTGSADLLLLRMSQGKTMTL